MPAAAKAPLFFGPGKPFEIRVPGDHSAAILPRTDPHR